MKKNLSWNIDMRYSLLSVYSEPGTFLCLSRHFISLSHQPYDVGGINIPKL